MTLATKFPANDWRCKYFGPDNLPKTLDRVEKLRHALPPSMSMPQAALRFILSNPTVSTTIVGMRKPGHVTENIAASDAGPLEPAVLETLKAHRWDRTPQRWSD